MPKPQSAVYRFRLLPALTLSFLLTAGTAHAQTVLHSGPDQVALLELYTSQGCSSCPPADRWLSRLKNHPGLWEKVVPLAFHVDYWDYIGWRDPFARPQFGQRQRQYARQGGIRTVYTPGMILNGDDWRGWTRGAFPQMQGRRAGILTVAVEKAQLLVHYQPARPVTEQLRVYIALLGFGGKSDVTAGENRGRELTDDFIVLDMRQAPLQLEEMVYSATMPAVTAHRGFPRSAIAAWVARTSNQTPLQAAGGWLQ